MGAHKLCRNLCELQPFLPLGRCLSARHRGGLSPFPMEASRARARLVEGCAELGTQLHTQGLRLHQEIQQESQQMERWHSLTLLEMREMPEEEAQRMEQQHSVFLREMERQWNLKQALLRVVLDLQAVLPLLRD